MIYLSLDELVYIAERAIGSPVELRDACLLEAAVARPRASSMLGVNGWRLTLTNDEAYEFIASVATGTMSSVDEIAQVLREGSAAR